MNITIVTERTFAAATVLFAVLLDPYTYPRWLVGTKNIPALSTFWPEAGSYFKHTVGFGPFAIPDRTTVRNVETPHHLTLFVRARPIVEAVVQFDVTTKGSTCTLRMTETPVGVYKVVAPIAVPLSRARYERSLQRLAAYIGTRDPPGYE